MKSFFVIVRSFNRQQPDRPDRRASIRTVRQNDWPSHSCEAKRIFSEDFRLEFRRCFSWVISQPVMASASCGFSQIITIGSPSHNDRTNTENVWSIYRLFTFNAKLHTFFMPLWRQLESCFTAKTTAPGCHIHHTYLYGHHSWSSWFSCAPLVDGYSATVVRSSSVEKQIF